MATLKLSDVISRYEDSQPSGDFADWLAKVELLGDEAKNDYAKLKPAMLQAFCVNSYAAYNQLQRRVLQEGEMVDVYLSDLRKLVNLIGLSDADPLLKCAFMTGLPLDISVQLKSMASVETLELTDLVARARLTLSSRSGSQACAVSYSQYGHKPKLSCYICGGSHLARDCSQKRGVKRNSGANPRIFRACYICGNQSHIVRSCLQKLVPKQGQTENMEGGSISTGCLPQSTIADEVLPFITIISKNQRPLKALVDSGCQKSVVTKKMCADNDIVALGPPGIVTMLNGEKTLRIGEADVDLFVDRLEVTNRCLVAPALVCSAHVILGKDIITKMGGVLIGKDSSVTWGYQCCTAGMVISGKDKALRVEKNNFTAVFDGGKWVAEWKWKDGKPELRNTCPEYSVSKEQREEFCNKVERWIEDGWLQVYDSSVHRNISDIIPLMAAAQPNKPKKVQPVMDYRELNQHVRSFPGQDAAVCQEKLRAWKKGKGKASILDLKKTYLQVHIADELRRFQAVKGRLYVMTRMGFALNVAPKILSKIVSAVLALDKEVKEETDHYIDDIWIDKDIVEDASWLRKDDDVSHINIAELEAVIKDINLMLHWRLRRAEVVTDSASVHAWVKSILEGTKCSKLDVYVTLVPSERNLADKLTRVPLKWLKESKVCLSVLSDDSEGRDMKSVVIKNHERHHLGIDRTLYFVQKMTGVAITRDVVKQVVNACQKRRSIVPHPVRWEHGQLSVSTVWFWLAVDVAFVAGRPYLTLVDCGPSRYAIWMPLQNETADAVTKQLIRVFHERGAPEELLMDNGPCFSSTRTKEFLQRWGVVPVYCCAYRHSGNGIVERNHRTIEQMVACSGGLVEAMVYWYVSPNSDGTVPMQALFQYETKLPGASKTDIGHVTNIVGEHTLEVNDVNRQVADVRCTDGERCGSENDVVQTRCGAGGIEMEFHIDNPVADIDDIDNDNHMRPVRDRRPPPNLADYHLF
ncbi:uncharacterized protein [Watersipora subatra]|uniref:uncharacterized protein n=1 Tax=Watersipora subatra TaxID=2589382 RepID=UPI00355B3F94